MSDPVDTPKTVEMFRLSWEMISPHVADQIQTAYGVGRACWAQIDWDTQAWVWHETSVEFTGDERMDQYRTLKRWAETREQPIRNVRLERGVATAIDWVPVEDEDSGSSTPLDQIQDT